MTCIIPEGSFLLAMLGWRRGVSLSSFPVPDDIQRWSNLGCKEHKSAIISGCKTRYNIRQVV
uniref:Putative ovule protein n=1 Tax=Solanum chacoense TaxID=4108 RepID=A0A0V0ILK4_SOLCH